MDLYVFIVMFIIQWIAMGVSAWLYVLAVDIISGDIKTYSIDEFIFDTLLHVFGGVGAWLVVYEVLGKK